MNRDRSHRPPASPARHTRMMLGAVLSALVLAACGSSSVKPAASGGATTSGTGNNAPASLRVMLDYPPLPQHLGILWALRKGLFAAQNLRVTILQPPSTTSPLTFIDLNKVDLAIYYEPDTIAGYGADGSRVVSVGALIPRPLASLEFAPGVKNGSVASLKGKDVAWFGIPYEKAFAQTILATGGLKLSDINFINAGFNASSDLAAGKVAASIGDYFNSVPGVEHTPPVEAVPVNKFGVPTYDELVVEASGPRLHSDPAYASAVRRFLKATFQGEQAAMANPSAAYTVVKSFTHPARATLPREVQVTLGAMHPIGSTPLGCLNLAAWQQFDQWLLTNKQIPKLAPISQIATNAYLPSSCP